MGNIFQRSSIGNDSEESKALEFTSMQTTKAMLKFHKKILYNTGNQDYFLSFSDYKDTLKPKKVEKLVSIHKDQYTLHSNSESLYGISFIYTSKITLEVTIFYFGKEIINIQNKSQYFYLDPRSPTPISFFIMPGINQEVKTTTELKLSKFRIAECNFENKMTFPVSIFLKGENCSLLYCLKIENNRLVKIKETYSIEKTNYEVLEVYSDRDECSICLTDKAVLMIYPCRHACLCENCHNFLLARDRKCPICRSYINVGYKINEF